MSIKNSLKFVYSTGVYFMCQEMTSNDSTLTHCCLSFRKKSLSFFYSPFKKWRFLLCKNNQHHPLNPSTFHKCPAMIKPKLTILLLTPVQFYSLMRSLDERVRVLITGQQLTPQADNVHNISPHTKKVRFVSTLAMDRCGENQ